jgi:transcriptional regulator of acetoin/glycerol metabolism
VDLEDAVRAGRFRADLLYRLNTIEVVLPTLAVSAGSTLERLVTDRVVTTWEQTGRNVTETARRLGVTRNTVYKKPHRQAINASDPSP